MTTPLIILAFMSVIAGFIVGIPMENGYIHHFLGAVLIPANAHIHHLSAATSVSLVSISIIMAVAGVVLAAFYYLYKLDLPDKTVRAFRPVYKLFYNKWYFDEIYGMFIVQPISDLSYALYKAVDVYVIDFIVNGFGHTALFFGNIFKYIQTGRIQTYLFTMILSVLVLLMLFYAI
jgi:NADH-quinone oxidoreductase subunit L